MELTLRATLHASPTLAAVGEVRDIRITGAALHFADTQLVLPLGSEVSVVLESPALEHAYELDAEITGRMEGFTGGRRYEVAFTEVTRAARVLDRVFEQVYNRRAASRVFPREETEVQANLRGVGEDRWFSAQVMNLSRTGIALSLDPSADRYLAEHLVFQLYLALPGEEQLILDGEVRSRRRVGGELIYGLAFTSESPARERLVAYVEVRRAETVINALRRAH